MSKCSHQNQNAMTLIPFHNQQIQLCAVFFQAEQAGGCQHSQATEHCQADCAFGHANFPRLRLIQRPADPEGLVLCAMHNAIAQDVYAETATASAYSAAYVWVKYCTTAPTAHSNGSWRAQQLDV